MVKGGGGGEGGRGVLLPGALAWPWPRTAAGLDRGLWRRSAAEASLSRWRRAYEYQVPPRRRESDDYEVAVSEWHAEISETFGRLILEELREFDIGAFLVWGDPTLYDSTLRILEHLRAKGDFELDYDVIPGISSVQALAAQHRVAINAIGRAVLPSLKKDADGGMTPLCEPRQSRRRQGVELASSA